MKMGIPPNVESCVHHMKEQCVSRQSHGGNRDRDEFVCSAADAFKQEAASYPVLSPEEEYAYGYMCLQGRQASHLKHGIFSEERQTYLDMLVDRGNEAETVLVEHNLRFLWHPASAFSTKYGIPIEEFLGAGKIGLYEGAKRFDPRKKRFLTYAGHWVKREMIDIIYQDELSVMSPTTLQKTKRYLATQTRYRENHGQEPTVEQMMDLLHLSQEQVEHLAEAAQQHVFSFDMPVRSSKGGEQKEEDPFWLDTAYSLNESDENLPVEAQVERKMFHEMIEAQMTSSLTPTQEFTLKRSVGWNGEPLDLSQIASILGQSKQAPHQKYHGALHNLQKDPIVVKWR